MSYNGPADENNAVHPPSTELVERDRGAVTIKLFPDSQLGNEEERMELQKGMNQPIINVASFAGWLRHSWRSMLQRCLYVRQLRQPTLLR